jgi:hypothetical protein
VDRAQMDHIIRAAADITGEREFVIIGSQAILGNDDVDPPPSLLVSMEADIYPARAPEKADLIDGSLGDGSQFHQTFGYYAHGIGPETAKAPAGWENRLIEVPVEPRSGSKVVATALFMELNDVVLSKCAAGRDRDWDYTREALRFGLVALEGLRPGIPMLPVSKDEQRHIETMIESLATAVKADSSKADSSKADSSKADSSKADSSKADSSKADSSNAEVQQS